MYLLSHSHGCNKLYAFIGRERERERASGGVARGLGRGVTFEGGVGYRLGCRVSSGNWSLNSKHN